VTLIGISFLASVPYIPSDLIERAELHLYGKQKIEISELKEKLRSLQGRGKCDKGGDQNKESAAE
jgi:hypothetical protein